ncbi:MAG: hypothetical protein NDJ90_01995 [Oligoflexia bacterium]|nr:hypothetical protein [Oligoflexia bacterium]
MASDRNVRGRRFTMALRLLIAALFWLLPALAAAEAQVYPLDRMPAPPTADQLAEQQGQLRGQLQQQLEALGPGGLQGAQGVMGEQGAELAVMIERTQKILSDPRVQRALKVLSDPRALEVSQTLVTHPKRMNLLYVEGVWLLFIMIFRAWLFAKPSHWLRRFGQGIAVNCVFLVGSSLVLPWLILGDVYLELLGFMLKAIGLKN